MLDLRTSGTYRESLLRIPLPPRSPPGVSGHQTDMGRSLAPKDRAVSAMWVARTVGRLGHPGRVYNRAGSLPDVRSNCTSIPSLHRPSPLVVGLPGWPPA